MASLDGMQGTIRPGTRRWEAICRRCGRCCYEKIDYQGEVYYTDTPCAMLDPATRLCRVYAERRQARPGCVALTPELIARGMLPADCPYVGDRPGYRPPHLWEES